MIFELEEFSLPYDITLSMTNDCNMACPYCYVQKDKTYMNFEVGKQCIDYAYKNLQEIKNKYKNSLLTSNNPNLCSTIFFFGGEPLLNFNIVQQIVKYANDTYPNSFKFSLTTNGILLTDKICKFFQDNNFSLCISFDGPKEIQDIQRPLRYSKNSGFDILIKNLEILKQYQNNLNEILVRLTITKQSVLTLFESYKLMESFQLFDYFTFDLEYFTDWDEILLFDIKDQLEKIYQYRFIQYKNNIIPPIGFHLGKSIINDYLQGQLDMLLDIPEEEKLPTVYTNCGYGLEMVCINGKGEFFPCHEEPDFQDNKFSHKIGDFSNGYDLNKLSSLRQEIKQIEQDFLNNRTCTKDCILKQNRMPCAYVSCPANLLQNKQVKTYNCELRKACLEYFLYYGNILQKENNKIFLNYLASFPAYNVIKDILTQPEGPIRDFYIQQYKKDKY